MNIRKVGTGQ